VRLNTEIEGSKESESGFVDSQPFDEVASGSEGGRREVDAMGVILWLGMVDVEERRRDLKGSGILGLI
jgi:hypothetical protein